MVAHAGLQPFWSPVTWVPLATSPYFPTAIAAFFAGLVTLTATQSPLNRWLGFIAAKLGATVLVAECSWRFFEGPINALKDRLTRKPAARPEGAVLDAGPGGAVAAYDSSPPAST
jgi:peptidoglycan/LPS O-acetylase OafA/YrhL